MEAGKLSTITWWHELIPRVATIHHEEWDAAQFSNIFEPGNEVKVFYRPGDCIIIQNLPRAALHKVVDNACTLSHIYKTDDPDTVHALITVLPECTIQDSCVGDIENHLSGILDCVVLNLKGGPHRHMAGDAIIVE